MRPFRYCFLTVQHESGWFPRLESPDSGMSRDFLCSAGRDGAPWPALPAGRDGAPWPALPAGRDFGPVRTCGAFPPTAARRAPHRSRSHGRLRRPKSLPIRHSPAAAQCRPPLGWRDCPVLTSWLHRFASLGLKSRIDARIAPVLTSWLHRFASLGFKSRIDAWIAPVLAFWLHRFASLGLKSRIDARIAPDLTFWLHRFASLGFKSRIDAWIAPVLAFWLHRFASLGSKSRIDAALSCRQVERPACGRTLPLR